jgi:hypothetical protein
MAQTETTRPEARGRKETSHKAVLRLLSAWQTSEWKSNRSSASGEISPITLSAYHSEEEHLRLKCEKSFVKWGSTKKGDECHLDSEGDETNSDDVWVAEDYSLVPSEEDEAERWDVLNCEAERALKCIPQPKLRRRMPGSGTGIGGHETLFLISQRLEFSYSNLVRDL